MCTVKKLPFRSGAGKLLCLTVWQPEGEIRAVVQLAHGMAEHIARYDRLARTLCAAGYAVAGHNHLGHGYDADEKDLGFFADKGGWDIVVEDVHTARLLLEEHFDHKPHILLGHSMGSFVAREYLLRHARGLSGCLISSTGWYPAPICSFGMLTARLCGVFGGWHKPAPLVDKISSSEQNKNFEPARTKFDWLSRDEQEVDKYINDPLCGFLFTARGYYDMFSGFKALTNLKRLKLMPANLPVRFIAGRADPIGQNGQGVETVCRQFIAAGMKKADTRLYDGARHELFNEINREEVTRDVIMWLDSLFANQ